MRYHTLFYAGLLPVALAQSAPSAGTGLPHPTGYPSGGVSVSRNESATWYSPKPIRHSSSSSLLEVKTSAVVEPSSSIEPTHKPYTKTQGFSFSNTTSEVAHSSGFAQSTGTAPHSSGTGVSHSTGIPSGAAKPTSAHSTKPGQNTTVSASSSGRALYSSKGHFFNGTSTASHHASGTGASYSSGSISSGFAKPTSATPTIPAQNITSSGRAPFSSGAHYFNGTSTAPSASGTGAVHPSGTGASHPSGGISSGFAKPSASYTKPAGNFTATSGFIKPTSAPAQNTTVSASASVRLPVTKGQSVHYGNSTSSGVASSTQAFYPTGTAVSSGFASPTAPSINSTASAPYTSTGVLTLNSTLTVLPTKVASTGLFTSSAVPTSSGNLPITKSSGMFFSNTSSSYMLSTGVASSGSLPTVILSTGGLSTGVSILSTGASAPMTSIPASSSGISSSKTKKHGHTVTVTLTGAPVTITRGGSTITDYVTITPSAAAPSSGADDDTTTVIVLPSASTTLSSAVSFFSSVGGGNLVVSTSASANATASSTIVSSVPTTLATFVSSSLPASGNSSVPTTLATFASSSGSASLISSSAATTSATIIPEYYQCGGINFTGSGTCAAGTVCKYQNPYYSQCVDAAYA